MRTISLPFKESELEALADFCSHARGYKFLMVGACARILAAEAGILEIVPRSLRATKDFDFGVMFSNQDDYHTFIDQIQDVFSWNGSGVKFYHKKTGTRVDIIPFGELSEHGQVTLAGSKDKITILGFDEAYECSATWNMNEDVSVQIASDIGLVILKIISYYERNEARDIQDVWEIMCAYDTRKNTERIYDSCADEIITGNVTFDEAKFLLLGKDIAEITRAETKNVLEECLKKFLFPDSPDIIRLAGLQGTAINRAKHPNQMCRAFLLLKQGMTIINPTP